MARIKVTGYLETEDLPEHLVDLDHDMGISSEAYEDPGKLGSIGDLQDTEFAVED